MEMEKQHVMSSCHRHRSCTSCFLCGKEQGRYDHYCTLNDREKQFIQKNLPQGTTAPEDGCMCCSHKVEARRYCSDPEYVPMWKRREKVINQNICCIYPECTSTSLNTKVINTPDIKLQEVICYELKREIEDIFLCEKHYQFFYRKLNAYHPCASCGAKPKVRQGPYFRHSPDPTIINDYLKDQTEENVAIAEIDTICKSC